MSNPNEQVSGTEDEDLRATLESAFEGADEPDTEQKEEPESEGGDEPDTELGAVDGDGAKDEPTDEDTGEPTDEATDEQAPDEGQEEHADELVSGDDGAEGKEEVKDIPPPQSYPPKVREAWKDAPAEVKTWAAKREREIQKSLEEHKEQRVVGRKFDDLMARYQPVLAAEGVEDPLQGVENLMRTVTSLRIGTPQQKAQLVAGFINTYGVDIPTLDSLLAGEQTEPDIDTKVQQAVQQAVQPYQQQQAQQQTAAQQEEEQFYTKFKQEHEFFDDVYDDMVALASAAKQRGQEMTIERAYNLAIGMNPEVSAVIRQREQAERKKALEAKKAAASSVSGGMATGDPQPKGDLSLREQLEMAWGES